MARSGAVFLSLLMAACTGKVDATPSDASSELDSGLPDGSPSDARLDGSPTDATPTEGGDAGICPKPVLPGPPGPAVTSRDAKGSGPCAGRTLGTVIDAVLAANPSLADIKTLWDPSFTGDGSYVYAYSAPDGGFALVLKRGGGDCPAGCTENEYWYFLTDGSCSAKSVGHFHPTYESTCIKTEGEAMWGKPMPPNPTSVCGADLTAKDISGSYTLCADGTRTLCSPKKGEEKPSPLPSAISLTIAQRKGDLSKGTVTLTGTGHLLVDGVPLDATFTRKRFSATKEYSNLPATCPDEYGIAVSFDFEGTMSGDIKLHELHTLDCAKDPSDYCKGEFHATLVLR